MKIKHIEKLTLIDFPGRASCILFLFGCNFKCGFCHNPELVLKEDRENISEKKVLEFLDSRKGKLDGVCITGGEPLMTLDKNFLKKIRGKGLEIKIDTNGSFPEKLKEVIDEGLVDFLAMDVKSSKKNYKKITNVDVDFENIEESMKTILNSKKLKEYEFRTTVVKGIHDVEEMIEIAKWLNKLGNKKPKKIAIQGFKNKGKLIEGMYKMKKDTPEFFLKEVKDKLKDYFEEIEIRF